MGALGAELGKIWKKDLCIYLVYLSGVLVATGTDDNSTGGAQT